MGVCSTKTVSRAQALQIILEVLFKADNETLSDVLYDLVGGESPRIDYPGICLNNFRVVNYNPEDE